MLSFLSVAQSPIDTLKQRLAEITDDSLRITYLNTLAYHYAFNKPDSAFIALDESMKLAEKMTSPSYVAKVHYVSAIVYHYSFNYPKSLEASFKALKVYEEMKDTFNIAFSYNELGTTYMRTDQQDLALEYFEKSLELKRKVADKVSIARTIHNIAGIHDIRGEYDLSLEKYQESIALKEEAGYKKGLGYSYSNVANIYHKLGRHEESLEAIMKAENFFNDSRGIDWNGMIYVYNTYADYYEAAEKDYSKALDYALKAYNTAKDFGSKGRIRGTSGRLSRLYARMNQYQLAYKYRDTSALYSDSINTDKSIREVEQLKASYEIDKRETEIDKQRAELGQQATFRNALFGGIGLLLVIIGLVFRNQQNKTKSLKEKDALLREIHHRVKNNLQVISSLLNMQSRETENEEMLGVIQEGQSRVKAMSLIHQKLYQTENISEIDFEDYTQNLVDQLATIYKKNDLEVENEILANGINLDIDTAIPLGLILNELISNAYKYAFEGIDKGKITIDLKRLDGNQLQLSVADDGKGLSKDLDLENVKSLGLKLVNILTRQLKGQLSYAVENGTRFSITFSDLKMTT